MALVRKKNRILRVNDNAVDVYLKRGYDQIDNDGNVINHATGGKMVSLAEFNKLKAENEQLKVKLAELGETVEQEENDLEKLTNDELKAKLDELGIEYGNRDTKETLIKLLKDAK